MESKSVCSDEEDEGKDKKQVLAKEAVQCFKKLLVVDGITERYWPCAVNSAKMNDGRFCILAVRKFEQEQKST